MRPSSDLGMSFVFDWRRCHIEPDISESQQAPFHGFLLEVMKMYTSASYACLLIARLSHIHMCVCMYCGYIGTYVYINGKSLTEASASATVNCKRRKSVIILSAESRLRLPLDSFGFNKIDCGTSQ